MKNTLRRLLCLVLCAVTVFALLPSVAMSAAAAEDETGLLWTGHENGISQFKEVNIDDYKTKTVPEEYVNKAPMAPSVDYAIENYGGDYYTFTTFADLKELASKSYSGYVGVEYVGSNDLVISQNLTLPARMGLNCRGNVSLVIDEDVTFTTGNEYIEVDNLVVNGTMKANCILNVYEKVNVTGTLTMNDRTLYLRNGAQVSGLSKIKLNGWGQICHRWDTFSDTEVVEAFLAAEAVTDGMPCEVCLYAGEGMKIDESISVPSGMTLHFSTDGMVGGTITFVEGTTLECNGECSFYGTVVMKGDLVNNSVIYFNGPSLTFDGGSYSGRGILYVTPENGEDAYTDIVKGLDATDLEVTWNGYQWVIRDVRGLPALGAPKSLRWNKHVDWSTTTPKLATATGWLSWAAGSPREDISWYKVCIYRDNKLVAQVRTGYDKSYFDVTRYMDLCFATMDDLKSGNYYFTVQAVAEGLGYRSSEVVKSETWKYTKPSAKYSRPTKLSLSWPMMKWSGPDGHEFYQLQIYYSATKGGEPWMIYDGYNYAGGKVEYPWIWQNGPGYYSFRVRTLSENITKRCNSSWSEMSSAYHYTGKEKPKAPSIKITGSTATGRNVVKWSHVPGAVKYRVYRATSKKGTYKYLATVTDELKYVDKTATPGKNYYYKVRAMSMTDVYSSYSNVVNRVADLAQPKVTISRTSSGDPRLKWEKIAGAEKYRVYRATSKTGEYKLVKTTVSATSYTDKSAKAGKVYYYKVRAIDSNSSGNSAYSSVKYIRAK